MANLPKGQRWKQAVQEYVLDVYARVPRKPQKRGVVDLTKSVTGHHLTATNEVIVEDGFRNKQPITIVKVTPRGIFLIFKLCQLGKHLPVGDCTCSGISAIFACWWFTTPIYLWKRRGKERKRERGRKECIVSFKRYKTQKKTNMHKTQWKWKRSNGPITISIAASHDVSFGVSLQENLSFLGE